MGMHAADSSNVIIAMLQLLLNISIPVLGMRTMSGRYIMWCTQSRTIEYLPT